MTPKQRDFCRFVANGLSAYQAAMDAGYSQKYAKANSHKLMDKPEVIAEINRLRNRLNERADKSAVDVVNEYSVIAFTDRVDFLKPDPWREGFFVYKSPDELTDEQRAVVEKVTTHVEEVAVDGGEKRKRQRYNYVLADKMNALQQMGRHFGIFDDKLKLSLTQTNPFKDATPEQLRQLKESWVKTMAGGNVVDGEFREAEPANLLPDGQGRTGTGT